jgi:hypothetical protein
VVVKDVHGWDSNDFVDAYIEYAEHEDGIPLTLEELESLPADYVWAMANKQHIGE